MIRRIHLLVLLALGALLGGCYAFAQEFVPLIADQTLTTTNYRPDGSIKEYRVTHQRVFRSRAGAILIQNLSDDPNHVPKTATLIDYAKTLKAFSISYSSAQAIDQNLKPLKRPTPKTRAEMSVTELTSRLGEPEQIISGFSCVIIPGYQSDANGSRIVIGRAWIAPDLNMFLLKEESVVPFRDGRKMKMHRETTKLNVGVDPDPALFETDPNSIRRAAQIHPPTP